ncbi:Ig-like domain-containing protein, partial [Flavobacterium sp. HJSW_4]|uniref:Ig-like domain-containing protein n=1 Tax=Flavobacterium sp. HJSW_4 TaxID=3344660 RepID=UPI0035F3E848
MCNLSGFAQTSISGIVNSYFSVTSINQPLCDPCVASCIHTITVSGSSGLAVGDKALIIQMKGATIDTRNIATAGNVTAINNTGNYEFFEIKSIAGNVVTPMYPLLKSYDTANGMVQVVRVPRYNGDVNIAGKLTAKEWTTAQKNGGVLAIETSGRLIFNADIDVAGQGYEGIRMDQNGPDNNCGPDPTALYVLNSTATASYTKGDGIVLDNANFNRGRAPRANGGGSGIAGDSGGGGGSNYGAGGEGGKRWCDANGASAGGLGGKSLSAFFADDRVFLGGAGGSGYVTTNNPSSAADGGGIVIIFAKEIVGNGHSIIADGFSPQPVNVSGDPDGGGGGGAGGTVVLKTPLFTGNLTVSAKGGDGQDLNTTTLHGPGGGGGGGALLYSLAALPANVTMNSSGGIGGQHTGGARNGSQDGYAGGSVSLYVPVENPNYVGIDDEDGLSIECDLDDDNDGILDTVELHGLPDPFGYQSGSKKPNFLNPSALGFVDTNKDTVDDRYDNDLDGMIDQLDLDSDNDGCPDSVEAYGNTNVDPDNNGFYGTGLPPATNTNGTVVAASYTTPVNTTGTSKPNYLVSNIVAITTSPSNRNANVGGNATFSTVVSGTHLVYTWKQSTNGGTTWTTVTNGGTNPVFSNATTNSLTLTNIPRSFHGYMYRLDVTSTSNVCAQPNSDTAILSIVNRAPVALNNSYSVDEGATLTTTAATGVLTNDSDADGDALTAVLVTNPSHGSLTLNANGSFTYVHDGSETTSDSFTYKANDGYDDSDTVTVNITVNPVNDAPVADNDSYTVAEGGTLTVTAAKSILLNDTDAENNTLTAVLVTNPSHGTLTLNPDGTFTYIHDGSETLTDSFTYRANDGLLNSNTATVNITITPVNDAPVANDDPYTVAEDNSVTLTPLSNDTDAEGDTLSIVSINGTTLTGNAQTITVSNGTVDISALGVITFTPSANFNSTTPISIPYVISDGHVGSTATANIKITVTAVNDAPVAEKDGYSVNEGETLTV